MRGRKSELWLKMLVSQMIDLVLDLRCHVPVILSGLSSLIFRYLMLSNKKEVERAYVPINWQDTPIA